MTYPLEFDFARRFGPVEQRLIYHSTAWAAAAMHWLLLASRTAYGLNLSLYRALVVLVIYVLTAKI